jgi:hypothetical protein
MSHHTPKPCGPTVAHPRTIANAPGLDRVAYRVGDFATFRDALLRPLAGETDLGPNWRPGRDDLALQLVEWFAYLADVLTFYGERWMQASYLRTAHPEEVARLVRLLGYRPRPAVAATGQLAADVTAPVTLPKGFAVQRKPGPGEEPQVFELDAEANLAPPTPVVALPDAAAPLTADGRTLWFRGAVSNVAAGDRLLVRHRAWAGDGRWAWAEVEAVEPDADEFGKPATRVRFTAALGLAGAAAEYAVARATQGTPLWPHGTNNALVIDAANREAHLAAPVRDVRAGSLLLFDATGYQREREGYALQYPTVAPVFAAAFADRPPEVLDVLIEKAAEAVVAGAKFWASPSTVEQARFLIGEKLSEIADRPRTSLVRATAVAEDVWYANGEGGDPTDPPAAETVAGVPVLHSVAGFAPDLAGDHWQARRKLIDVRHDWREVGQLIAPPVRTFGGTPGPLRAVGPVGFPIGFTGPVLVEGADGKGSPATLTVTSTSHATVSDLPVPAVPLATPLKVWTTLLPVSRGQTVEREVLGGGDARVLGQEFVLKKKPLTYLPKADPDVGRLYTSTLRIWVDGVRWKEVAHFHGQPEGARVYVTREDDEGRTHVRFATRLPTGASNVVASYRYGAGAADPAAGSLTTVLTPRDGLRSIRNPVRVGGGADAEPPGQLRRYAPRSVLAFDRAVSADDYEAIAAQAPGVARARTYWRFDPQSQRGGVVVYVGDDPEAAASARAALRDAQDPNRPARVEPAQAASLRLTLVVKVAADRIAADVLGAVRAALLDPDRGLFGSRSTRIGRAVYESELSAACLAVPGVRAVRIQRFESVVIVGDMAFLRTPAAPPTIPGPPPCAGHRLVPDEGMFFTLAPEHLDLSEEAGDAV